MQIIYSKDAAKTLRLLNEPTKSRIKNAINRLPGGDVKKLKGFENAYRLRVGNLRILFEKQGDIICVDEIDSRGNIYK